MSHPSTTKSPELFDNSYTFTWKIKNFSFNTQDLGEYLDSPIFTAEDLNRSKWKLRIYPRGYESDKYLSIFLHRCHWDKPLYNSKEIIEISVAFFILDKNGKQYNRKSSKLTFCEEWGIHEYVQKNELFRKQRLYMPQDILNLNVEISKCMPSTELVRTCLRISDNKQKLNFNSQYCNRPLDDENLIRCRKCTTVTEIEVDTFSFSFEHELSETKPVIDLIQIENLHLRFQMLLEKYKGKFYIAFSIVENVSSYGFYAIKIHISQKSQKLYHTEEHSQLFTEFKWDWDLKLKPPFENNTFLKPLTFTFEIRASGGSDFCTTESWSSVSLNSELRDNSSKDLKDDILKLYSDKILCDLTLVTADGQELQAHKSILSLRSPVFKSMFANDTSENRDNRVKIDDVDIETLDLFLQYIYSLDLCDLEHSAALRLYTVSDKYQVLKLKDHCRTVLKETLKEDNVPTILYFADVHQDADLKAAVLDFIRANEF